MVIIEVDIEFVFFVLFDILMFCINQDIVFDLSSYVYNYIWFDCDGQVIMVNDDDIQIFGFGFGEQCYIFFVFNSCGIVEKQIMVYVIVVLEIDVQLDIMI